MELQVLILDLSTRLALDKSCISTYLEVSSSPDGRSPGVTLDPVELNPPPFEQAFPAEVSETAAPLEDQPIPVSSPDFAGQMNNDLDISPEAQAALPSR